jgi:hypothetical protein
MLLTALALAAGADLGHQLPERGRNAAAFVPKGWTQESAHTPDLDKDGKPDLVMVVRAPENENRRLLAARATANGYRNIGEAYLPTYPLGDASVNFTARGVLVVEDLTGGTTATNSIMRYRYAPPQPGSPEGRMRYIGLDVTVYSRTNRHDATKLSYNWLTGERSRQIDKLTKRGDYAPQPAKRAKGEPRDWYMEDTADPDDFLSAEMGHGDKN